MEDTIFIDIHNKAEEFCSISRLANESSKLRKKHSEEAITFIKQSLEIGDILGHEFEIISQANKTMRDQDSMVQNYCIILESNITRQNEILRELGNVPDANQAILKLIAEAGAGLSASLQKAIILLHMIIQNDNEIILMDQLIINRKKQQREAIDRLKKLAFQTLADADNAIRGSMSNLKRGLNLVDDLANIRRYLAGKSEGDLERLIDEANLGWNTASAVHRSSASQLVFAEQVSSFTERLHEDSNAIRDLVVEKHALFSRNLELTSELTIILSLELKEYLYVKDLADGMDAINVLPGRAGYLANNLASFIAIACRDILFVSNLNFDMTDSIALNADLEIKSVNLTKTELEYFDRIKNEVQKMTEVTKYPIEGSERNIANGKLLESYLRQIRKEISA